LNHAITFPRLGFSIDRSLRPAKFTLLAAIMAFVMLLSGFACNQQTVQTWVSNIDTILQEVSPAVSIIVALLPLLGTAVPPQVTSDIAQWQPKVQNDISQLASLIQQGQGDLANNPTTQGKINALIATTQQDVLSILPVFQVLDPASQAKVVAAVNVIAAAITSVENIVNNIEGKVSLKATPDGTKNVASGKDFKKKFNAVLKQNFGATIRLK
jgi:hypothetical protein